MAENQDNIPFSLNGAPGAPQPAVGGQRFGAPPAGSPFAPPQMGQQGPAGAPGGMPGMPGMPGMQQGPGGMPGFPGMPGMQQGPGGMPGFPGMPGMAQGGGGIPFSQFMGGAGGAPAAFAPQPGMPPMGGPGAPNPLLEGLAENSKGGANLPAAAGGANAPAPAAGARPPVERRKKMNITIRDRTLLYNSWMSFSKTGGLFVPSEEPFKIGDEVMIVLNVMEHDRGFILLCKVGWISASAGNAAHPKGVGLVFPGDDNGRAAKAVCEMNLAGLLDNPRMTYTM